VWQNCSVLVTGAGGFIGSHLVERLVSEGSRVRAFVRYNSRHDIGLLASLPKRMLQEIEIVSGDLRDIGAVRQAMTGIQVVFHLGALISIPYSYLHPREVTEVNIMGTLNILQAARDASVRKVVHTSSSEVYGTAQYVPIDEKHPLNAQSPYAASKIGADQLAQSFHLTYDLPVTTIRPFNTFGPRQSMRAVIPTIIVQALSGNEVRLGSLRPRRDFTYVDDTVAGMLCIAAAEQSVGRTFNIGGGADISIGELAERIAMLVGKSLDIALEEHRLRPDESEVWQLLADNTLARQELGWQPIIPLEDGLKQTIEWVDRHLDHYHQVDIYQV
jgi:NAD dependent epimerase/dehydratase